MGSSKDPKSVGMMDGGCFCLARPPAPLGWQDYAAPFSVLPHSQTPGSLGIRDWAAYQALSRREMCPADATRVVLHAPQEMAVDQEVAVIDLEWMLKTLKISAQNYGVANDAATLARALREFGFKELKGAVYFTKVYKGKEYIIFKGYPGLRKTLTGTRYASGNAKVVSLMVGRSNQIRGAVNSGVVTLILVASVDIVEFVINDEKSLARLGVTIFSDLTKSAIASVAGAAVATVVTGGVVIPLAAGIAVAVVVSLALDAIDERFQLTSRLADWAEKEEQRVKLGFYEFRRQINAVGTPEGFMWMMRRLAY